jgi:mono/diheme cytochrome c family protein
VKTWLLVGASVTTMAALTSPDPIALPERLSQTGLFIQGTTGVDPRNRPFTPQYPLWSDGLEKSRWIYVPAGAAIDASDPYHWDYPVGTKFWKEFRKDGRRIETRVSWKVSAAKWELAAYAWNEQGTDAVLVPDGVPGAVEVAPNRRHSIPSKIDCATCHSSTNLGPLGFNALQLSPDRDPNAIHGEPLKVGDLTLTTLIDEQLLMHSREAWTKEPPRIRTDDPSTRAVLGYLASNCGVCHNGNGEIAAFAPVLRHQDLLTDADAVVRSLLNQPTRWQLPGTSDGTVLVRPGAPEESALFARMRSRSPSSQMPPLGTTVRDQAAVDMVHSWIRAMDRSPLPR